MVRRGPTTGAAAEVLGPEMRVAVLHGPEEMIKRHYLDQFREALEQKHGPIEPIVLDGKTVTLSDVLDELREYSLLQSHKLVIVDEADQFIKPHRAAMERYVKQPVDHASLVLRATTWHKSNLDKLIGHVGAVIKCEAMTAAKTQAWLRDRARLEHERTLTADAAIQLMERVGPDLMKLDNELAKLALLVDEGQPIGTELVDEVTGRSSDEQAWQVQEAVLAAIREDSPALAIEKIHELVDLAGRAEVLVTYCVADLFRKLQVALLMKRQGAGTNQIARQLRLWGPKIRPFMAALDCLEPASVERLFSRALRADERAKRGLGLPLRNLECFCATLSDECR